MRPTEARSLEDRHRVHGGARAVLHPQRLDHEHELPALQLVRRVGEVVERFGRLDILVNNNAYPPTGSPTEQVSDAVWHEMTARLLDEPFFCLRAALRVMRPVGRGKSPGRAR